MLTIYPYLINETWVFDDPKTNLKEEAFVLGSSEVISRLVASKRIDNAFNGFTLSFSMEPFDGFDAELNWIDHEVQVFPGHNLAGNWYEENIAGQVMRGWLCPALDLYFESTPAKIYIGVSKLPDGVNPIWEDFDQAKSFVLSAK